MRSENWIYTNNSYLTLQLQTARAMAKDEHVAVTGDSKPAVPRTRRLTPELQKLVDREEEILDQLYEGK